jgi:hypothetical protein
MSTALWTPSGVSPRVPAGDHTLPLFPHPGTASGRGSRRIRPLSAMTPSPGTKTLTGLRSNSCKSETLSTQADTWNNSAGSCTRSCGLEKPPRIHRMVVVHSQLCQPRA